MKKILVIDSDNNAQCEIIELLNNDETQITYAKSVREALKIFFTGDYSLVILDAGLSECDGYRLLEVMQAVKPTPILVLSAKNGQHYTSEKYNALWKKTNVYKITVETLCWRSCPQIVPPCMIISD